MSRAFTTVDNVAADVMANVSIDKLSPSILRAPDPFRMGFHHMKIQDIKWLVTQLNTHKHTSTCYKYAKNMERKTCRMRMPREICPISIIDPDSGEIRMRRSHPMINNFNQYLICACRCNMDIKFIWSGTDAKALVYYCTDYITKTNLSFHDTFSLVQKAIETSDNQTSSENSIEKARKLVLRCYNSLASQQELSGTQVITYLMDSGDHYTGHTFVNIFLIGIERYLQNELNQAKTTSTSSLTTAPALNSNLSDTTIDEEEENAFAIEEQFLVEHSSDRQKLVLVNLRVDYQYRSVALESICLYEFVSLFSRKSFNDKDREIANRSSYDTAQTSSGSGRPLQERHTFMAEHPRAKSHGIIKRTAPIIPVLIGPQIPRQDREETQERYNRAIATLFIPWRSVRDLCDGNQNWSDALSARRQNISVKSQKIIDNIQLLHECKTDRDAHLQQIMTNTQSNDQIESRLFPQNMRVDSDDEDEDADQTLLHLDFLDDLTDNNRISGVGSSSEKEQHYQNEAIRCLKEVGRFSSHIGREASLAPVSSLSHISIKTQYSVQKNAEWQAAIKADVLRKRQQDIMGDNTVDTDVSQSFILNTTALNISDISVNISTQIQPITTMTMPMPTRREVRDDFTLNDEQARAFYIVCRHADGESHLRKGGGQQQLIMCVPGAGGTGKSRLINAITYYFVKTQRKEKLRKLGPTAVSASLIGGNTIHSFLTYLRSTKRQKKTMKPGFSNVENDWKNVEYLIIDEISMVGLRLLARLNEVLTLGKRAPPEVPFGGINVIFLGDYIQYMPVLDKPLYANLEKSSSNSIPNETDVQYKVGRSLVLQINTVTKLTKQMRTEDVNYLTLLNHLRLGETTRADFEYLCKRIIGPGKAVPSLKEKPWCDAPILVFRNQLRTEINNRVAVNKAKEMGTPLIAVVANDKVRSKYGVHDVIYERLLHLSDNKTELLPGFLPLIPNMPVLLTDNIACELGLSNGTQGIFRELVYDEQEDSVTFNMKNTIFPANTIYVRKPLYALVEINSSQVETNLDGLQSKIIPISLVKKEFTVSIKQLLGSLLEKNLGRKTSDIIHVTRTQLPIVPAFAITTYKAQGLTMGKIVVDLQLPPTTSQVASIYVPLSRVKKAEDVAILRPFDMKVLQIRPSAAQSAELTRLDELDKKTQKECVHFTS